MIHLAATIRDQPRGTIEELNGLATVRLLRSAERAGVQRFLFFSAMGATCSSSGRARAKALAEKAVREAPLETTVFALRIVYGPGDPWITPLSAAALPAVPVSGSGQARYSPMARDVAACVVAAVNSDEHVATKAGRAKSASANGAAAEGLGPRASSRRARRRSATTASSSRLLEATAASARSCMCPCPGSRRPARPRAAQRPGGSPPGRRPS